MSDMFGKRTSELTSERATARCLHACRVGCDEVARLACKCSKKKLKSTNHDKIWREYHVNFTSPGGI